MEGGNKKLAMLHIKKQFECTLLFTQWLRNVKVTYQYRLDWTREICSSGECVSRDPKALHSKEDSIKLFLSSLTTFPTNLQRCYSRRRCSIPTVIC